MLISILIRLLHKFANLWIGIQEVHMIVSQKRLKLIFRVLGGLNNLISGLPFVLMLIEVALDDVVADFLQTFNLIEISSELGILTNLNHLLLGRLHILFNPL